MTDKKKHEHEEEINETNVEAVETPESSEQLSVEIETLEKQLEAAESKASEYKDGWMRS